MQLGVEDVELVADVLELLVHLMVIAVELVSLGFSLSVQPANGVDVVA